MSGKILLVACPVGMLVPKISLSPRAVNWSALPMTSQGTPARSLISVIAICCELIYAPVPATMFGFVESVRCAAARASSGLAAVSAMISLILAPPSA